LFQQRVTALGCNCRDARTIGLCETEFVKLGCDISRNWRRIAFRVCGTLYHPQPVKIVCGQIRVHNQSQSYAPVIEILVVFGYPSRFTPLGAFCFVCASSGFL